jgi:hypothetical protein
MLEDHSREQYFWDDPTLEYLATVAGRFDNPACLCAPLLGSELERRNIACTTLDIDTRFQHLKGYTAFDIYRPIWQGSEFGVIFCDPPFWIISLSQLFAAIRLISQHNFEKPLAICYPARRGANLVATFSRFNLKPTGYFPTYRTVQTEQQRSKIEFFANFEWPEQS